MTKKLIVIIGLFITLIGFAQENTSSPYSYYGLGEVKFRGTEDARAMGGLSFAGDSISLNLLNPASYADLKLTSFGIGSTSNFNNISNSQTSEKAKRTTLDYIAVGIPMGKFGTTVGLMPYSAVGYKVEDSIMTLIIQKETGYSKELEISTEYLLEVDTHLTKTLKLEQTFNIILEVQKTHQLK